MPKRYRWLAWRLPATPARHSADQRIHRNRGRPSALKSPKVSQGGCGSLEPGFGAGGILKHAEQELPVDSNLSETAQEISHRCELGHLAVSKEQMALIGRERSSSYSPEADIETG